MNLIYPLLLLFSLLLHHQTVKAQKENNVWPLGDKSGFDFNSGAPVLINTASIGLEGSASVCDAAGNLLFYTNNEYVWDKTHNVMPNGHMLPKSSSMQGVTITPIIDKPNQYYIFSVDPAENGTTSLRYSIVDLSLNGGKGDIISGKKDISIRSGMGEKITMAPTCNAVWLITHHIDSPLFYAFKVHPSGLIDSPIISTTVGTAGNIKYKNGEIKLTPDITKILRCNMIGWELFGFNGKTGIVEYTPLVTSPATAVAPGEFDARCAEFSEDGSKLYTSGTYIFQHDLSLLPSATAVLTSRYSYTALLGNAVLRLGPDGKIYSTKYGGYEFSCIQEPNKAGAASNLIVDIPSLRQTLPNYHLHMGNKVILPIIAKKYSSTSTICKGEEIILKSPISAASYRWNDGASTEFKKVNNEGVYWVESSNVCLERVDTFKIITTNRDTQISRTNINSCFEQSVTLKADTAFSSWLWDNGSVLAQREILNSGTYWVKSEKEQCHIDIDTFVVTLTSFNSHLNDTSICKDEEILVNASVGKNASYRWQDNSVDSVYSIRKSGQYSVKITLNNCSLTDTINVSKGIETLNLGRDTLICKDLPFKLESGIKEAKYNWSNGLTDSGIPIYESGQYILTLEKNGCIESDTINISVVQCDNCFHIANAFSPNADGKNDLFNPMLDCPILHYSFMIVNRYGQQVFASQNPNEKWDGKFNNIEQQLGVYYYLVKVKFDFPGAEDELYKGDVILIR